MAAVLRAALGGLIAVAAVLFALANRDQVAVIWSPFAQPVGLPFFLPVLSALAAGFLAGALFVWLSEAGVRAEKRRQAKTIRGLEQQIAAADKT